MTGSARRNVPSGTPSSKIFFPAATRFFGAPPRGLGLKCLKFVARALTHCRAQIMRHVKHDIVRSPVLNKSPQLILQIFGLLSCKPRYRIKSTITLSRWPMAVLAVPNLSFKTLLRDGIRTGCRRENNGQNYQVRCCFYELHDLDQKLFQVTDIGRDRFDLWLS